MDCLRSIGDYLRDSDLVDKQIVSAVLGIIHLGRAWAVEKNGMLRSNNLISDEDVEKMEEWLSCMSDTFCLLMDGCDDDVAFESYYYIQNPIP
ncbi:MAG: hypothetical protein GY714_30690 [Desulfobacterales bacterium]|nr:hypothetical protein [Desulfobacterales bacterium]